MMAEPLAAALHGVAKHYHGFTLGPLNLEIPAGSIVGLIGENGAGKTTLLKLLTGVNRPDAGTVELLSATPDDAAVRAKIGVVFEDAYFYESLTPAQVGASLRGPSRRYCSSYGTKGLNWSNTGASKHLP